MNKTNLLLVVFTLLGAASLHSCGGTKKMPPVDAVELLHHNQYQLTQVIIYDVFTPPVASRIYVYAALASYEALRFAQPGYSSIASRLNGFPQMPVADSGQVYHFSLAATRAFFTVVKKMVFSTDSLSAYENAVYDQLAGQMEQAVFERSVQLGDSIGNRILAAAKDDGYTMSRGKAKHLGSNQPGKWHPTPPDYMDGVEWCWNSMRPLTLSSAAACLLPPPPQYSIDTNSVFFKEVKEVYDISKRLTEEQRLVAKYWDDNPFVIEHSGHLMFGNKKITPGGHWMGIAGIAARQTGADEVKTAQTLALTAIALYDGFIACWDEKYRSNTIRPVSVINQQIEKRWTSFLQTPPFPEYPSGHSTITRAAATVLTKLYGDNFAFLDTSDLAYIGLQRNFNSFIQAADEASISRVYGGIHYRKSVDAGALQGKQVGEMVIQKLGL